MVGSSHGLYRVDPRSGERGLVFDDPDHHELHAKILAPRTQPDGRSSVVNEKYPTGKLYCLNAYLAEPFNLPHMKPGMIKSLRVIEGVPEPYPADGRASASTRPRTPLGRSGEIVKKRILGVVPVEKDGSFHIEVPADTPIQLQTLDADGLALRTCGWIWVKHREPRGCIGCHEDPQLTPENRFVDALKKPGMKLTLPPQKRRTVDFRRDVMPTIVGRCLPCHEDWTAGRPELAGDAERVFDRFHRPPSHETPTSFPSVLSQGLPIVSPGAARKSPLVWPLLGQVTARPWDALPSGRDGRKVPRCPPSGGDPLSDEEVLAFIEWIDLGAQWDGIPASPEPRGDGPADMNSHGEE
jgi:hypothetical protein